MPTTTKMIIPIIYPKKKDFLIENFIRLLMFSRLSQEHQKWTTNSKIIAENFRVLLSSEDCHSELKKKFFRVKERDGVIMDVPVRKLAVIISSAKLTSHFRNGRFLARFRQ
jgi:alpha-ketoglutarate-dependent taurine dioxygenase